MTLPSIASQTEQVLEWHVLLGFLANEASSTLGAQCCRTLASAANIQAAQFQQQETTEMVRILQGVHPLPPLSFPDIKTTLARAEKKGLLDGEDLRNISLVLGLSHSTKNLLRKHRSTFPTIGVQYQNLRDLEWVKQAIDRCIDINGQLLESASPELYHLTQKSHGLRQTIRRRLEEILVSQEYEESLQGRYFAERENRYVIPVKAARQHDIDGIVHDISSSGATVFVEPRHLIELNNSIKFVDLQMAQEARHVLQDLTDLVSENVLSIQENLDYLARLDCLMAKARLSIKMHASPIHLNQEQRIVLHQARHPILALTKDHVVANSIRIEDQTKALIISGPNAGGKTVSIKQVGLIAMMVKVGLHPPCSPDSDMAFFERIYADIGDTQDLSKDISSFAGHILNIIALLKDVGQPQESPLNDSLILLDEVGSSTDPIEGAALAEALLGYLCELGCIIVATTHYPSLKTLALRNHQFRNASQELDLETFSPTYRLIDGMPGGSSALVIAERLGLNPSIIKMAHSLIQQQDCDLNNMLRSLHEIHTQLEGEITETRRLRHETQRLYDEAQVTRDRIQSQERDDRQRYQKQWQREFSKAQRYLNQIIEDVKKDKTKANVRSIQQNLGAINAEIHTHLPNQKLTSLEILQNGDLVEIVPFGTTGTLLESVEGKKQVCVRIGFQTLKTSPSDLRLITPSVPNRSSLTRQRAGRPMNPSSAQPQSGVMTPSPATGIYQHELDIRGIRMGSAMEMVLDALDCALANQAKYLKVIHGHGSGVLKSSVRKLCESSTSYIKSFRVGDPGEGGDGVTIIELE